MNKQSAYLEGDVKCSLPLSILRDNAIDSFLHLLHAIDRHNGAVHVHVALRRHGHTV